MNLCFHPRSKVLVKISVKANSAPDQENGCVVDDPGVYPQHRLARKLCSTRDALMQHQHRGPPVVLENLGTSTQPEDINLGNMDIKASLCCVSSAVSIFPRIHTSGKSGWGWGHKSHQCGNCAYSLGAYRRQYFFTQFSMLCERGMVIGEPGGRLNVLQADETEV